MEECSRQRKWQLTLLLSGKFHGMSMGFHSPWGHKESDTTERLHFHFSPVTIPSNILNRITSSPYLTHYILSTAFKNFLFLAAFCCCSWAFSSSSKQGLPSSCSARASHCRGFPCGRAQGTRACRIQQLWPMGLVAP